MTHKYTFYLGCDAQATMSRAEGARGWDLASRSIQEEVLGRRAAMDGGELHKGGGAG